MSLLMNPTTFEAFAPQRSQPRRFSLAVSERTTNVAPGADSVDLDDLGRLVQITHGNDRLLVELEQLTQDLNRARGYLATAGCNASLGVAQLSRVRAKRSKVLTLLRANRLEAGRILGEPLFGE